MTWFELSEINQNEIKFVILLAKYNDKLVIIKNTKRGGWEIPGGNREQGESVEAAARRELYEETGAIQSELEPFGIIQWNGSYGMVFYAAITQLTDLLDYEIEEVKFVDQLPAGLNMGELFYLIERKWMENSMRKETGSR